MRFWTLLGEKFLHVPTQAALGLQAASRDSWNVWEKSKTKDWENKAELPGAGAYQKG